MPRAYPELDDWVRDELMSGKDRPKNLVLIGKRFDALLLYSEALT